MYWVSAVRYNADHSRIEDVREHFDPGRHWWRRILEVTSEATRETALSRIQAGGSYSTMHPYGRTWKAGDRIRIVAIDGERYLRVDSQSTPRDYLGDIPQF
jgi:hypothetical protein